MIPRLRGLLPGLLFIVVLPLTLVLIVVAIAATTLHQNEMRTMVARVPVRKTSWPGSHRANR